MWFVLANWTRRNVTKAKTWKVLPYWSLPFLVTGDLRHQVKKPRLAFWIRRDHMERGFSHLPSHHPIGVPKHVSEAILGHPIWVKLMKNGKITFSSPERVEINTTVVFLSQHSGGLFCTKTNKHRGGWSAWNMRDQSQRGILQQPFSSPVQRRVPRPRCDLHVSWGQV